MSLKSRFSAFKIHSEYFLNFDGVLGKPKMFKVVIGFWAEIGPFLYKFGFKVIVITVLLKNLNIASGEKIKLDLTDLGYYFGSITRDTNQVF